MSAVDLTSGKGHRDENFPVASFVLRRRHRAPIMAFYRFARAADDIADHPTASAAEKLAQLDAMRAGLSGDGAAEAVALRAVMAERGINSVHAHDLITAFERDVTIHRYQDWNELIDYCRYSAMPVGRYVLDVHGESRDTWRANDALCAALQVINHLQDCAKDRRSLDRVYIPLDTGLNLADLDRDRATPQLRKVLTGLTKRTRELLHQSAGFAAQIHDRRLAAEVAAIHRLAVSLCGRLEKRDPLSQRVHHGKIEALLLATGAAVPILLRRRA